MTLDELPVGAADAIDLDSTGKTPDDLRWVSNAVTASQCMEMTGGGLSVLDRTVGYVQDRYQFNRPIASFQAAQHHVANMHIALDAGRLTAYQAVFLAAPGPIPQAAMLLSDLGADVIRIDRAGGPPGLTGLPLGADPRTSHLLTGLGLDAAQWPQHDRERWPELTERIAGVFATASRDHWAEYFGATDACVTPVLSLSEAAAAQSLTARSVVIERDGLVQPAPAPRLSDSPPPVGRRAGWGSDTDTVLTELGFSQFQIGRLRADGVVSGPDPATA